MTDAQNAAALTQPSPPPLMLTMPQTLHLAEPSRPFTRGNLSLTGIARHPS